jgi:ABC-type sugar transport system substrate-binding protein
MAAAQRPRGRASLRARFDRRRLAATLALGAATLALAGCGGDSNDGANDAAAKKGSGTPAQSGEKLTIGVSLISQQIPILASITKEFEKQGEANGYETIVTDPNNDATKQAQQVRALIERGVDGLVTGAVNPEAFEPVLKEAVEKGIPTVLVGIPPLENQRGLLTVDFDWGKYGYSVGEAFAKCMNERFGGKGEIGLITTTAVSGPVVADRMAGEKRAIKELAPGETIAAEADAKSNRVKAVQAARTMLRAHPDIVGFTGIGDSEVLGAMQAFREAGKDPKEACFVGLDGSEEGVEALGDGTLYAEFDPQYANWMKTAAIVVPSMARDPESAFWNANTILFSPAQAEK